jgi:hypothetical protein
MRLGWRLLDNALVTEIARKARVEPELARRYDERVDSWAHRVSRLALWGGAFEGVSGVDAAGVFDAETEAALATSLIREAHTQGNCVIVGRGGQCVLHDQPDVFHAFVYAPRPQRVARIRRRAPHAADPEALIAEMDAMRARYVKLQFGCDWANPHLYHLLVNSSLGEEAAASLIVHAMSAGRGA